MKNWVEYFEQASENLRKLTEEKPNVWDSLETPQSARLREAEAVLIEGIDKWTKGANENLMVDYLWKALKLVRREQK